MTPILKLYFYIGSYKIQAISLNNNFNNYSLGITITYSEIQQGHDGVLIILIPIQDSLQNYVYFSLMRATESYTEQHLLALVQSGDYNVLVYEISSTGYIIPGPPVLSHYARVLQGMYITFVEQCVSKKYMINYVIISKHILKKFQVATGKYY